jgi:hypothetical protein
MKSIKIIVEKHPDGYIAYPLGISCSKALPWNITSKALP